MVHLRIVAPSELAERAMRLLDGTPSTCNLIHLSGVAHRPAGDVILVDVAREDASIVIADLKELGVAQHGSISLEQIDSQISDAARAAEHAARGLPSDAVVWEEVESRTSETIELGGNFLAFMILACLIGSIGIFTGSPILIIGAMVVGPEFGPLAGLCVAIVQRRRSVARRSLLALAVGFPVGITAAFLFTLFCDHTGLIEASFRSVDEPLTRFIAEPEWFSIIVATFAGAAGMLSLTSAKSGALIGVLISVTTIPAAANIGVSAALGDWDDWRGAIAQLSLNLVGIVAAGVITLYLERRMYRRRRRRHRTDGARTAAGLPTAPRTRIKTH